MTSDFGNWLAGFIDGEGCFLINNDRSSYRASFKIELRCDDRAVLDKICDVTSIGHVVDRKSYSTSAPAAVWLVQKRLHKISLVELLEISPLRSKKLRDFNIWKRAVALEEIPRIERTKDLQLLKAQLENGRKYDG